MAQTKNANLKHCPRCQKLHPEADFPNPRIAPRNACRHCRAEYNRQKWRRMVSRLSPEQRLHFFRNKNFKVRYGITLDRYDEMFRSQGGCCAICKRPSERLVVDHRHHTTPTVIRELLCSNCNSVLGFVKESVDTLQEAIRYLKRWGA